MKTTFFWITIIFILLLSNCTPGEGNSNIGGEDNNGNDAHQEAVNALYATYDQQFRNYLAVAVQAVGKETIVVEPLLNEYTIPKKVTITGTPYEIGYTIGHIANQYGSRLDLKTEKNSILNQQIIEMYERIYPQYLEFVRGVADAYGVEFGRIDFIFMEYGFSICLWCNLLKYYEFYELTDFGTYGDMMPSHSCSVVSYYIPERHIIGRNFDNPSERPHYFATTNMEGCFKMMGNVIYCLYQFVVDGINEKGLSINCASNREEYYWEESYPEQPAVYASHMARIVMDTCSTVDEAIELMGSVRIWFPNEGLHWIIADASGKSVVVEFDLDRKIAVFDRNGPYEIMTNTALQKGEEYIMANCWRYRTAKPMIEAGIQDTKDMLEIMKAIRFTSGNYRTLWTSIMDINNRSFEIFYRKEYSRKYEFRF